MKRLGLFFLLLLVILLAGGAIGAKATPAYAQGYGGYVYPPPPPNPLSTPWVGPNTPWVFYQGDWFLNGILYHFFGNKYGWAPYYAYPPVYIVRPNIWYAPKWNAWYRHNPHHWQSFHQQYPYWRGHRVGQRYDQKFYDQHHHGQGKGWHRGFSVDRPPTPTAPHIRSNGPTGPGVRPAQPTGPGVRPAQPTGTVGRPPTPTGPQIRSNGPTSPGVSPAKPTGPEVRPAQPAGSVGRAPGAAGRGAPAPEVRKPEKAPRGEERPQ